MKNNTAININSAPDFRKQLLEWFDSNKRSLPWRENPHWYKTFLSEFLLQQTQVDQALPYFDAFIKHFPDVRSLAEADQQQVLNLWAGLGYYSRARNLLRAARAIVNEHQGNFPADYRQSLALPGIGPYTAAAILSIAFNQPYPVIDGNVLRVLTRILAIPDDIRSAATKSKIEKQAALLLDPQKPGLFNEGIMELGALICKPKKPLCTHCPLQSFCSAYKLERIAEFPFKSAPAPKRQLKQYVVVVQRGDQLLLVKRPDSGLLASMWEFPNFEVKEFEADDDTVTRLIRDTFNLEGRLVKTGKRLSHTYSHIKLQYIPVIWHPQNGNGNFSDCKEEQLTWQDPSGLQHYPIHNAHKKIIRLWFNN